jgi:hypothetical protein
VFYARQLAALPVIFLVLVPACSDGGSTNTTSSSGQSSSSSSGGGGTGGAGGAGGAGGSGGSEVTNFGPGASDFVNAGNVSKSPGYKLEGTLGQSTQNQSKMSSPGYRLQGGLIGANGSVP